MKRKGFVAALSALTWMLIFGVLAPKPSAAQELDPEAVNAAIAKGVRFLKNRQQAEGHWDGHGRPVGMTSLCVIALLSSGVPKDDPTIVKAMQFLRRFKAMQGTHNSNYEISLQTMAFALYEPERDLLSIRENVQQIEKHQTYDTTPAVGGWTYIYTGHKEGQRGSDNSNAQFPILALYEAERVGVPVNRETWNLARRYWERGQNQDGSWGYTPHAKGSSQVRASMTCAGIASLMISAGMTGQGGAHVNGDRIVCAVLSPDPSQARIQAGLAWMERNFSVVENKGIGGDTYLHYYLYCLERVGRMSGQRFIGTHDWYREGTEFLVGKIENNVSWRSNLGDTVDTAFALLFLSRGRRPVLMSKVEYGGPLDKTWNVHPNDVDHLTRFVESRWGLDLTWQVITLDAATVEDLMQTPVLYLCGSRSPLPKDPARVEEYAKKLRAYLDQGGFIFAEAQPNDESFDKGFRELMREVLPEEGYELRPLEPEHPIWQAELTIDPDQIRLIEGIGFGCRTSVVYVPVAPDPNAKGKNRPSLSCLWEVAQLADRGKPYPAVVQRQIDAGLGLGINILAYATNREMKTKDLTLRAAAEAISEVELRRGRIFMGLAEVGAGVHSAPRALPNMLQWAGVNLGLPVDLRSLRVNFDTDQVYDFPVVFMHGRGSFRFSEAERERIAKYVERGGTLFINAICSSQPFIDAFEAEMAQIFPEMKLEAVAPEDPLLSDRYGGFAIDRLEVRLPQQSPGRKMHMLAREAVPELRGIKIEDRWAVVFSPLDVSCALEKTSTLDCKGYTQESALKLTVNVLLYALGFTPE